MDRLWEGYLVDERPIEAFTEQGRNESHFPPRNLCVLRKDLG
jgi:hypothetical protein